MTDVCLGFGGTGVKVPDLLSSLFVTAEHVSSLRAINSGGLIQKRAVKSSTLYGSVRIKCRAAIISVILGCMFVSIIVDEVEYLSLLCGIDGDISGTYTLLKNAFLCFYVIMIHVKKVPVY